MKINSYLLFILGLTVSIGCAKEAAQPVVNSDTAPKALPLVSSASEKGIEVFADPHFQKGFTLYTGEHGERNEVGLLAGPEGGGPVWGLSQWFSKTVFSGKPTATSMKGGALRYENPGKEVIIAPPGSAEGDVFLRLNSSVDYPDGARKKSARWSSLLMWQQFSQDLPKLVQMDSLVISLDAKLVKSVNLQSKETYNPKQNAAQFVFFVTVQNKNKGSPGYGNFIWFGIPIYDNRYRIPPQAIHIDKGTNKLIYNPGGILYTKESLHDGKWVHMEADILPIMKKAAENAIAEGNLPAGSSFSDYKLGGMNMGWEMPGTFDAAVRIRNLSLKYVPAKK